MTDDEGAEELEEVTQELKAKEEAIARKEGADVGGKGQDEQEKLGQAGRGATFVGSGVLTFSPGTWSPLQRRRARSSRPCLCRRPSLCSWPNGEIAPRLRPSFLARARYVVAVEHGTSRAGTAKRPRDPPRRENNSRAYFFRLQKHKDTLGVVIGAILGHSVCTFIAVIGGRLLAQRISVRTGACLL